MELNNLIIDENNIAFNPTVGTSYQLSDSAKEIIQLLKEGKSKEEIIEILSQKYDVAKEELYIDVSDFFAKLKVYGLIE